MTSIKLYVNGAHARAQVFGELTSGSVGIEIDAKFNDEWDNLSKHLVCRNGKIVKTKLDFQNGFTVAPETMIAGGTLEIGFEGMSQDGKIVFPTVWASCGVVKDGANANDDYSADPTNPVWDQLEKQIGDLNKLETDAKSSIVDAVNEVAKRDVKINVATANSLGGIKAEPVTENDTQPVRIGEDGMLFTAPGGGEKWETIIDYTVPEDCSQVLLTTDINGNPFSLKKAVAYFVIHPIADPSAATALRYAFDSSAGGYLYGAQHFWNAAEAPKNAGKATACRFDLQKTNEGVIATSMRDSGGEFDAASKDIQLKRYVGYERIDSDPLTPATGGINAVGVGSYNTAVGAGTRIKLLGVRE